MNVIAERELAWESDSSQRVRVLLEKPESIDGGAEFRCWYRFEGSGIDTRRRFAAGVDGLQAIQLALVAIAAHIEAIEKEWGGRLRY